MQAGEMTFGVVAAAERGKDDQMRDQDVRMRVRRQKKKKRKGIWAERMQQEVSDGWPGSC